MSNKNKVSTIADLIKRKEELIDKDKNQTRTLQMERTGLTIVIEEVPTSVMLEAVELGRDDEYEGNPDAHVVYEVVIEPNLKDKGLQDAYGCIEPVDIVSKLFNVGEIKGIAEQSMEMAGYNSKVTVVDKVKKK